MLLRCVENHTTYRVATALKPLTGSWSRPHPTSKHVKNGGDRSGLGSAHQLLKYSTWTLRIYVVIQNTVLGVLNSNTVEDYFRTDQTQ